LGANVYYPTGDGADPDHDQFNTSHRGPPK
jgi:hypothetical protein